MKKHLPIRSESHKEVIEHIVDTIRKVGKKRISHIILFGSFARGDFVDDFREEKDGSWTTYNSDYDLLVLTKEHNDGSGSKAVNLENKIQENIDGRYLSERRVISIIVESLNRVNNDLKKGHYFFSDIKKDGILLYKDENVIELSEAKKLTNAEMKEIAEEEFLLLFSKAKICLKDFGSNVQEYNSGKSKAKTNIEILENQQYLNKAAFELHQTTESLFNCIEMVFANYRPKLHDLEKLNKRCIPYCKQLTNIFPKETQKQKDNFDLLKKAYVESRYNKDYVITLEQLIYLEERVIKLQKTTKQVCQEKIESFSN